MTTPVDPVVEADLQGYIDHQLPVRRRIAVEAYLAGHPQLAARVMQDLRLRDELTLALQDVPASPRPATSHAARRLARALRWRRRSESLRRTAAIGLFLAVGWFAHAQYGALGIGEVAASGLPPAHVEEAIARLDAGDTGTGGAGDHVDYDPRRILAETAIVLPSLPDDWRVEDVVIAPSTYGPGVGLSIRAPELGRVSLVAVRPGVFDVVPVTAAHQDAFAIAHWQIGDVAYALVTRRSGADSARDLDQAAAGLVRTLY